MTSGAFDSPLLAPLFGDPQIARLFTAEGMLSAMIQAEIALAQAEAECGVIPHWAADHIAHRLGDPQLDLTALCRRTGPGTEASGVPVVAMVEALQSLLPPDAAPYLHWGPTSHDIMDLGLILQIKAAIEILMLRLDRLVVELDRLADRHRATAMVARTRGQQAVPSTFGLKAAGWLAPMKRHAQRLLGLKERLLVVQFGGAAGTLVSLDDGDGGNRGLAVAESLARHLDLGVPAAPWHVQRDTLAEFGGWLALITGSLGKMGTDILWLSQNEVGEVSEGGGPGTGRGGSSTMPQKANPVRSEALISLARVNAGHVATLYQSMLQEHERGGAGWQMEWLTLPQMVQATGGALARALDLVVDLQVNTKAMARTLDATNGLVLAEPIAFALARHMPKPDAQALVKSATRTAIDQGRHLIDVLRERTDAPLNWDRLRDPARMTGLADIFIERIRKA